MDVLRVVIDTNILVGAAYNPGSASGRIVEAVLAGRIEAVVSPAMRREYEQIVMRAVRVAEPRRQMDALLRVAKVVEPEEVPRVVPDDPADDMLLAAAVAGGAGYLITSDRHVRTLDPYQGIRIVGAEAFLRSVPLE